MSETCTLWQRCEALGPMEDQGVQLYRTDSGDYRIFIDRATVFHVHQDGTIGDYCRAWLGEAIVQRFEAITMKDVGADKETVHSFSGGPKEWRERFMSDESDGRHRDPNFKGVPLDSVPLPIPNQLPDVTYVVEAPKEDSINGTRYRMCKDQPAQIDCRETKCRFYAGAGTCVNVSPALVLHEGSSFWCKSREPKDEQVVEAPKPTEPTQEQLKAIWDHVTHLTMEQETRLGIQYVFVGAAMHAEFQLHIKSVASCKDQWRVRIAQDNNGVFRSIEPFDLALTCHRLGCFHVANSQVVTESPLQFVSIPVDKWQKLTEAFRKMESIFNEGIQDVEFES